MASGEALLETIGPIWRQWGRYVSSAFSRVLGPCSTADDLTQQVFLALCQAVSRGEEFEDVRAYLAGTISNTLRRHSRQRPREVPLNETKLAARREPERSAPSPNDVRLIEDLVSRLPWDQRYIVVAYHYLRMGRDQIGETLGLSRTTVSRRHLKALASLRKMAEHEDIEYLQERER